MKIADFGKSRILKEEGEIYAAKEVEKVAVRWSAPEVFGLKSSVKSDIWCKLTNKI